MDLPDIIRDSYRFFSSPVWRIEGQEKDSGASISTIYCGPDKQLDFVLRQVYGDSKVDRRFIGRKAALTIDRILADKSCSLAVVAAPMWGLSFMERPGDLCVPWWIDCEVDSASVLNGQQTHSLRSDLRKVRKHDLQYTISNTAADFEFFYRQMYEPTIRESHGSEALPSSYLKRLKQIVRGNADLLLVKKESRTLGGVSIDYRTKLPVFRELGVIDGDSAVRKFGVVTAAYYFGIEYLHARGYRSVGLGLSRCFLNDGVLKYKRKWQPTFARPSRNGFLFRFTELNDASRAFLLSSDCITVCRDGLSRAHFTRTGDARDESAGDVISDANPPGISTTVRYDVAGKFPVRLSSC